MNQEIHRNISGQQGLSLIEIMISLALGIILLGGTLQLLITSKNSYRLQDGIGSMQENGRYAIHSLRENILVAGYPGFANIEPFISDGTLTFDGGKSDQIAIKYKSLPDCLGKIPASSDTVVNVLAVKKNALECTAMVMDDSTQLLVQGETLVLVEDVESMQILYGVDDDDDGVANLYVNTSKISDWNSIVSVRIALLARSREVSGSKETQSYQLLDGAIISHDDGVARKIFTTTVPLRNRIL